MAAQDAGLRNRYASFKTGSGTTAGPMTRIISASGTTCHSTTRPPKTDCLLYPSTSAGRLKPRTIPGATRPLLSIGKWLKSSSVEWSHLFRTGKKLKIDNSFICKEEPHGSRVVQQQGSRARQLAQRDQLLETQEAVGQPRVWKDVYDLMRCNGNLCPGSYCYVDEQRKHMGLNTSILTKMVEYAEQGNELRTHRDMPPYILDMIYEKERLDGERRAKRKASSLESDRPIKIVNVLPSPYGHSAAEGCTPPSSNFGTASLSVVDLTDLVIPKPIDRAVDDYTEWLCDQVEDEHWKAGFRSAGSITKADCLDLRHVYQDRDIGYYVSQGVKAGIARSFVQDIKMWADSL